MFSSLKSPALIDYKQYAIIDESKVKYSSGDLKEDNIAFHRLARVGGYLTHSTLDHGVSIQTQFSGEYSSTVDFRISPTVFPCSNKHFN
jgi:hypothetical protein